MRRLALGMLRLGLGIVGMGRGCGVDIFVGLGRLPTNKVKSSILLLLKHHIILIKKLLLRSAPS